MAKRHKNATVVALANKLALIAWTVLRHGEASVSPSRGRCNWIRRLRIVMRFSTFDVRGRENERGLTSTGSGISGQKDGVINTEADIRTETADLHLGRGKCLRDGIR
jgi:hypothetical protein